MRFVDDPNIPAEGFEGRVPRRSSRRGSSSSSGARTGCGSSSSPTATAPASCCSTRSTSVATPPARGAGWHLCLEGLHADLDGGPAPPETDEAIWNEVHGAYLEAVGGERHVWGEMPA